MTKKINVGISILRIWMCFEVVLCHFKLWNSDPIFFPDNLLKYFQNLAVPIFMLLSFILMDFDKLSKNKDKIKLRYYRLVLPHVLWSILYFIIFYVLDTILNTNFEHGFKDLIYELLLGHSINKALWFQVNLIWITSIFIFIFRKFNKKKAIKLTISLGIFALFMQYSNINWALFNQYIKIPKNIEEYIIYPLGRFAEVLPYAVIGILINQYKLLDKLKKYKNYIIPISLVILIIISIQDSKLAIPLGFQYQGFIKIIVSLCLVSIFYYTSFDKVNIKFNTIVNNIAKLTMGVYFIHNLIGVIIFKTGLFSFYIYKGSILDSLLVYIISLIIVFILSKIPIKFIKDSVV